MREFSKITPQFWIGETGRELRAHGPEAQIVAMYLLTAPTAGMLGLYYLPIPTIVHDTGLSAEGASKGLRRVCEGGFASYDEISGFVWVHEMARIQVGQLSSKDNRVKGIRREYASMPNNPFLGPFFEKYTGIFHIEERREGRGFGGASETLRSQETETEIETEKERETETDQGPARKLAPVSLSTRRRPGVEQVLEHYCLRYPKRRGQAQNPDVLDLVSARLATHSPEDLCQAIDGNRDGDDGWWRKKGHTELDRIMESDKAVDKFIALAESAKEAELPTGKARAVELWPVIAKAAASRGHIEDPLAREAVKAMGGLHVLGAMGVKDLHRVGRDGFIDEFVRAAGKVAS